MSRFWRWEILGQSSILNQTKDVVVVSLSNEEHCRRFPFCSIQLTTQIRKLHFRISIIKDFPDLFFINLQISIRMNAKDDSFEIRFGFGEIFPYRFSGNFCCLFDWKTIDSSWDWRKSDCFQICFLSLFQATSVSRSQILLALLGIRLWVDRTDCMDDMFRR